MIESILQFDNLGMLPGIFCTQFKGRVLSTTEPEGDSTQPGLWTLEWTNDWTLDSIFTLEF